MHPQAWTNHVVVLRLDLRHDPRADHLDPRAYSARFQRVIEEQVNLRNRRVALWVQRADDAAAMMLPAAPEVLLLPGATSEFTETFAEGLSEGEGSAAPEAPDLEGLQVCTTTAELMRALALPEDTSILIGQSQRILDRWAAFRDKAIADAELAVGAQWDEYERVLEDPDAERFRKINARRDIENALRRAHTYLIRYRDLAEHPEFAPLIEQVLERTRELSKTPSPRTDG